MSPSLLKLIQQHQPYAFDQFMQDALYHPQFGYYNTRVDFGARGDFVTAPTLTSAFSHSIGRFLLKELPKDFDLIELGPGNGQLAYDLLLFLQEHDALPNHYYLVETSNHLKKIQEQKLSALPKNIYERIHWVQLEDLKNKKAFIIANEFLDALPVVRFKVTEHGIKEIYVQVENDQLVEVIHDPRQALLDLIEPLNLEVGYTSEACLLYKSLAQIFNEVIEEGAMLILDYGYPAREYYQPMRHQGTLQAYYQHQALNNYLERPGAMDLTAHVDFTHLSMCLINAGFTFEFFAYQNVFLLDQNINEDLEKKSASEQQKIKRLLDPRLMGESFKVIAFSKNFQLNYTPSYSLAKFL